MQQLEKTAMLPGMRYAVGLPDLHPGKGSPIGAAFACEGFLYPTLVGNDIGCGIGLWQTGLRKDKLKRETWTQRLGSLEAEWQGDVHGFLQQRGVAPSGYEASLGTIGSGNHFAELQMVESISCSAGCEVLGIDANSIYLCVHSGSRGFGEAILREHMEAHQAGGLAAGSDKAIGYLERHRQAKEWAVANRELIALRMTGLLLTEGRFVLDICHNSVEPMPGGQWLHRKGAAPSTAGPVVIPGSRGAYSYLVEPLNPTEDSGYSLAHGAGRKWSRTECRGKLKDRFSAKDLLHTKLGSTVICEDKELLYEEAPQAYKNIDVVISDLVSAGLAKVLAILRPVITYKTRRKQQ